MKYIFTLYFNFYWRGAILWAFLWSGLFYQFFSRYALNLTWWWIPAFVPLAITAIFRSSLYLYYLASHARFFNQPQVIEFLTNHPEFTLGEFSKATKKPQAIAHYFLIHSPLISITHEDICIYKVNQASHQN